ncbi:hypothetical protein [Haloarcula sp. JP-L23]
MADSDSPLDSAGILLAGTAGWLERLAERIDSDTAGTVASCPLSQ